MQWQLTVQQEKAYGRSLAPLLASLPGVTAITVGSCSSLVRILGRALCCLESPMANVKQLSLDYRWGNGLIRPHALLQAMAKGRLPGLEALHPEGDLWEFIHDDPNTRLLERAIQRGRLSQLTQLWMEVGPAFYAALRGFQGMSEEVQQRQKPLERLVIQMREDEWEVDVDVEGRVDDDEEHGMAEAGVRMLKQQLQAAQARGIFPNAQLSIEIDDNREAVAALAAARAAAGKTIAEIDEFLRQFDEKKKQWEKGGGSDK